jgi:uncharacterized coiled-coil DUF342 family protein
MSYKPTALCKERELRKKAEWAAMCGRYKQERDLAEADATNFSARIFELINERDEARELLASEKITRDHIIKRGIEMQKERDEAIELLKIASWYSTTTTQEMTEKFLRKIGKWEDAK